LVSALLFVLVACSHDDDESRAGDPGGTSSTESAAQTTPALRPCSEDRHVVVFDFMGVLIEGNLEVFLPWIADGTVPATRPGARELVQAYRERTTAPTSGSGAGGPGRRIRSGSPSPTS